MQKVIVIGVDGATLDLMEPWMDQGELPHFDTIRKQGVYGKLRSTIPHYSAPAWTSIVTGCNPGKHGIYDFFRTDSFSKKLVNSRYRKAPALWSYLSDQGKRSIVVNVPGTYPPEPIHGVMITGLLTPSLDSAFTHPSHVKKDLVKGKLGDYELEQVAVDDLPKHLSARYAPGRLRDKVNAMTVSHATVTANLMTTYDWDFTMVVFRGLDDVQHLVWDHKELVLSCYKKADEYIGKLMASFPDAFIVVVSDHGFGKPKKYLYVNNVLYNTGFLKTFVDPDYNIDSVMMRWFDKLSRLFFHLLPMEKLVRSSLGRKLILAGGRSRTIDFSRTKAVYHSVCSRGIRINFRDKYDQGTVRREDYEHLRNELITLFQGLRDPETGERVVKKVHRWEDVYGKNAVNDPLDLILDVEQGYGTQELLGSSEKKRPKKAPLPILTAPGFYDWMGDHTPYGVVFMYGKGVKENHRITASVTDVVPTVLAVMNLPLPEYLDGTVVEDAFVKPPPIKKIWWEPHISKEKFLSKAEMEKIGKLKQTFQS